MSNKKWLAVTVSLGDEKYYSAQRRLRKQAEAFKSEFDLLVIDNQNFANFAPWTISIYSELLNDKTSGYGYWIWKAEICESALSMCKDTGYLGVIYIDVGCELFGSPVSRFFLKRLLRKALKREAIIFASGGKEIQYTKRYTYEELKSPEKHLLSNQIAATWFILTPRNSQEFVHEWARYCRSDRKLIDFSMCDSMTNHESFIAHRADQSIFSLISKKRKIPSLKGLDYSGRNMKFHIIRRHFHPIWTARNFTDESIDRLQQLKSRRKKQ